jgi:hypothetical protein
MTWVMRLNYIIKGKPEKTAMSNSQPTKIIMNKIEKKNSTNKRIKKKKKELKITRTEFDTKK